MADPTLEPVGEYTKITNTPYADKILRAPKRPYGDTPTRCLPTPIRFPSNVGIVRVFYRTLPLHKGVIADYNL